MEYRKLTLLKELPGNPRVIKKKQFDILCKSIQDNKEYFEARPLILSDRTGELIIIAGNQRFKAAKELKVKEVPTYLLTGLSEEKEREITIRDNINNGEWEWEQLANEWDQDKLLDWGLDIPNFAMSLQDQIFSEKEIDGEIETSHKCPKCGYEY